MIKTRIRNKRDSLSNWSKNNPVLLNGEIVIVEDGSNVFLKRGDGTSHFNSLPYISASIDLSDSVTKAELQAAIAAAETSLSTHTSNKSNPHNVTKSQLGLDNVDNTADAEKEVKYAATAGTSTKASQDALGNVINTTYATTQYVEAMYADSSTSLSTHTSNKSNPHGVTKEQLGLGKVDNTADADKEVKKAATADLATKATKDSEGNVINTTYATIAYADAISASATTDLGTHTSNKSNPHNVTKAQLGLDKVDNTSDAEKRVLFAETAGNVESSEKDGDGNVITATYATKAELEATAAAAATSLSTHTSNKSNPHNVTKAQLGLDKVDNTSDAEKRVLYAETAGNVGSSEKDGAGNIITETYATKAELEASYAANNTYTDTKVSAVQSQVDNCVSKVNTGVQSIAGGLVIGSTSATATGKGRIMLTGQTNPLIGIQATDASGNQLTPYYFQVANDVMYLGPTSTKALSFDKDGKTAMPAELSVAGKISEAGTKLEDKYSSKAELESTLAAAKTYTDTHINNKSNPHGVTKAQLGLDKVDNTADADKTVKKAGTADTATKATQDASGNVITTTYATKSETESTLAAAKTYTDTHINNKSNPHGVTKAQLGLGNVDNTADANKTVKKAGTADTATKATQDASGNVITTTYSTKAEATAIGAAAQTYTDTQISTLRSEISNISTMEFLSTDSAWAAFSDVYKLTKAVGTAQCIGVYKQINSTSYEAVCVDAIEHTTSGNLVITSPDKFTGFALMSKATAFNASQIENIKTMIRELFIENNSSIGNIEIKTTDWTSKTVSGSTVYTFTRSVGKAKVVGVYETVSTGIEQAYPDRVVISSGGTLTIESPSNFAGYILLSSPEPFDKTALDNMQTLILNKTVETVGSNVVKTVNGIAPTNGAVTIPAVHEVNGIKFAASKWVQNATTGLFTLTLSAGGKSILGCYRTASGVSEWVIPDSMKILSNGNVEIISPVKFDGYIIISTVNWL